MKKNILVAPLNWGLGHATRCIPIIKALQAADANVLLASDGRAYKLLAKEFPELPIFHLPAYNVSYKTHNMTWNIALQTPKIAWAILREQIAIRKLVREQNIHAIISDNRFGCFHFGIPTVFMTHQVNLKIPFRPLEILARWGNCFWIKLFQECWIPDVANHPNLSGELSHDIPLKNVKYIGILSHMQYQKQAQQYDAIAVISGPEPQRTYFEQSILEQASTLAYRVLVVGGKPEQESQNKASTIKYVSFLGSKALNEAIAASGVVISRSGYSTLMDLAHLQKKAILIPTPGQTEQEYLATHFMQQGIFYAQSQEDFDLKKAMQEVQNYEGWTLKVQDELSEVIRRFLVRT